MRHFEQKREKAAKSCVPGNNGSAHQLPRQHWHAYHHRHQDPHHGHPHSHQHLQVGRGQDLYHSSRATEWIFAVTKLNCIEYILNRSLKAIAICPWKQDAQKIVMLQSIRLHFDSMIFHDASISLTIWVEAQSVDPVWVKHWKMSETSELQRTVVSHCFTVLPLVGSCALVVSSICGTGYFLVETQRIVSDTYHFNGKHPWHHFWFEYCSSILKLLSAVLRCHHYSTSAGSWQPLTSRLKLQSSQMFSESIAQCSMGVCNGLFNSV